MAYCGLRQFEEARRLFDRCMHTPATAASAVAVAAYKKYVLVSLILDGKCNTTLPHLPQALSVVLPRHAEAYADLAAAASGSPLPSETRRKRGKRRGGGDADNDDIDGADALLGGGGGGASSTVAAVAASLDTPLSPLERVALDYAHAVSRDGNLGLLKQALVAEQRVKVKRQTKTYLTMSLAAIADRAGVASETAVERLLVRMVASGEINAKISAKDGMVAFADARDSFGDAAHLAALNERIARVTQLGADMRRLEQELELSPALLKSQIVQESEDEALAASMALDAD